MLLSLETQSQQGVFLKGYLSKLQFTSTQNQFVIFGIFIILGLKYACEQFFLSFFQKKIRNSKKYYKFLIKVINVFIIILSCFEFYVLCLTFNFGIVRAYMVLGSIVGAYMFVLLKTLVKNLKFLKIAKKQQ